MIKNHGIIEGKRDTDYVGGTIPYEVRNPSGDWTNLLPPGEWQANSYEDTMACVTFSALNSMEVQYKLLTGQNRNFSDRFTAKMSGTTYEGNYLYKVWDSIRKDGVIDEGFWSTPANFTWSSYYAEIPQAVKDQAKLFLNEWTIQYEFIDATKGNMMYHLKHAPLQIVIPGHAVMEFLNNSQVEKYFDSYSPFIKDRTQLLGSVLKGVLTKRVMVLTAEDVQFLQALEGFSDPEGVTFWTGKTLTQYKDARVPHKIAVLQKVQ